MKQTTRERNKEFFWKIVGAYCRRCGYKECISALQLHHLEEGVKTSRADVLGTWLTLSRYNLVKKLADTKFSIFCANCHIKLHAALRERDVHINPVDVSVFKEMLKCIDLPKRIIDAEYAIIDDGDYEAMTELENKHQERYNLQEERMEMGIDCEVSECGFCGIENIINKEVE